MMYEIKNIQSHLGEPDRRWFYDHDFDLCVWLDAQQQIVGFQIVYDKLSSPHALTWWEDKGFTHNRVIDDRWHLPNTLVADGTVEKDRMMDLLKRKATDIDQQVVEFVTTKLAGHSFETTERQ